MQDDSNNRSNALLAAVAVAAACAVTTQKLHTQHNSCSSLSGCVKCDASIASAPSLVNSSSISSSSGSSSSASASMKPNDKPRNIMLHRMKSLRARCLQDKYDINWHVVLGEGAYGAVYPGKLASVGEKVNKLLRNEEAKNYVR